MMSDAKKGTLLCVDDEPYILRSLQWLLKKDFQVQTAVGGTEGLQMVKAHDFDVIMSDQRMPGMTGAQFLAQVKDLSPRSMRLLLTGYSDMPDLLSSVNDGEIWQFIQKPWNNENLKHVLSTAVQIAQNSAGATFGPLAEVGSGGSILLLSPDDVVHRTCVDSLGEETRIVRATSLAEAVHVLANERIGTIVSEARVGTTDVTRFLTLVKQKCPEIVSVAVADSANAGQLIQLINGGQLYRFASKPLKTGYLRLMVRSAMAKHNQLLADPLMRTRYAAVGLDANLEQGLMQELGLHGDADQTGPEGQLFAGTLQQGSGLLHKLRGGFAKLFGRH